MFMDCDGAIGDNHQLPHSSSGLIAQLEMNSFLHVTISLTSTVTQQIGELYWWLYCAGRFNYIPRVSSGFLLLDLLAWFFFNPSYVITLISECTQTVNLDSLWQNPMISEDPEETDIYTVQNETWDFIPLLCGRLMKGLIIISALVEIISIKPHWFSLPESLHHILTLSWSNEPSLTRIWASLLSHCWVLKLITCS